MKPIIRPAGNANPGATRYPPSWGARRVAGLGALVGALHALASTAVVGWHFRNDILAPPLAGRVQLFDPASKLLGTIHYLPVDFLQHFYAPGLVAKLPLLGELFVTNVIAGALLGLLAGMGLRLWPRVRSNTGRGTIFGLGFLAVATLLHGAALIPLVVNPQHAQTLHHHLSQITRRMLGEGPAVDLALTALAVGVALWLSPKLQRFHGIRAFSVASAAAVVALVIGGNAPARNTAGGEARPLDLTVRPQNVVLVSIDSLRADHLGCYGYQRPTSPRLDELAAEGVRFSTVYAASSWTLPSHASMLTGRYPLSHGAVVLDRKLSPATPTVATILQHAGYTTGGFVSFEFLRSRYGFNMGFDYFDDFTTAVDTTNDEHHRTTGPLLNGQVIPWIEANADHQFFLFVHYFDVHYDYDPPPPYDTMFDPHYTGPNLRRFSHNPAIYPGMPKRHLQHFISLYDGEIRFTDGVVGELIDSIDRLGLRGRTLLIVTADHGDEFFEHGDRGHGTTLYDEVERVPLIIRWPDGLAAGRVVDIPVSLVDLAPTIYELTGVAPPAGIGGNSLVPALFAERGKPEPIYAYLYARKRPIILAMSRYDNQKYIQNLHAPGAEFYEMNVDPGEKRSRFIRGQADALTASLLAWLRRQWKDYRTLPSTAADIDLDRQTVERLRALGYVD